MRRLLPILTAAVIVLGVGLATPATALSADGRSVTDGQRTLTVSAVAGLDPAGQVVQVMGSGFDTFKGVYVAFCVIPPTNQLPSPCGGGVDMSGTTGASHWISSNPPPYGEGVAVPYGPGGSFAVSVAVGAALNNTVDCRRARCAVVTRNDHVRSSDRSQDLFVPVSFAAPAVDEPAPPPASEDPTPTPPPTVDSAPAPTDGDVAADTSTTGAPTTTASEVPPADNELAAAHRDSESGGGSFVLVVLAGLAVIAVIAATATVVLRRRASP